MTVMATVHFPPFRILLVDDSRTFLEAARHALAEDARIEVVGSALSGQEGLALVAQQQPDLVLMDVAMPDMNGMEAMRLIKAQPNAPYVVILTSYDLAHYRIAAQVAGADHFISKADFDSQLFPLLETLLAERSFSS
jgi:DNA-binding NarL/FixJ family response regulator